MSKQVEVTREPWEVAWEREYPGDAAHFNSTSAQPFRMIRERWRFQRGYEVGAEARGASALSEAENKVVAIAARLADKLSREGSADDDIGDELFELHEEVVAMRAAAKGRK